MDRQTIEQQYGITLTDNQWRIVQAEVAERDDDETDDYVISDVVSNITAYEAEYAWWEAELEKAKQQ